ncbi:hypothetical protein BC938DRAFT_483826 [Jimgerdemannia flammicorona]|uniref:Uncharacterized protein n=1 Tax=Jimgerdemannia flammicorona TaxID=994334 RepID=A0A433QB35_9FUNG|nr:hypothetical protein BC938DRAFT_483826 [Jimgerdemannia flammicorona]
MAEVMFGGNNLPSSLSQSDDFVGHLYDIYLTVKREGIVQVRPSHLLSHLSFAIVCHRPFSQSLSLGLHCCDYLLHVPLGADRATTEPIIQQVEFNTIASSFGSLSALTGNLHPCRRHPYRLLVWQFEYGLLVLLKP